MYFYYGITNSSLENPSEHIELAIDQSLIKVLYRVIYFNQLFCFN